MRRTIIALIGALLLCGGIGVAQELSGVGVLPGHADVGVPRVNNLTLLTGTWTCLKGDSWCREDSGSGDAKTELADGDVILMTDGSTWYSFTVADADSSSVDADNFRRARLVEGVLQSSNETLPLIDSSALYLVGGITASTLDTVVDGSGGDWPFQVAEDEIYFPSGVTITVDAGATMSCPACTDFATMAVGGGFGDTGCSITAAGALSCDGAITSAVLLVGDGLDATGADDLDIGSADVTEVTITTDGGALDVGTTSNVLTFTAAAGQTATFYGADDAGAANTALDTAGAGTITIGSADVTAVTITTDSTGDGTDLVLPENGVSGNEAMIPSDSFIACGQNDENGTIYLGPALAPFLGDGSTSYALGTAGCDGLDNATEGTADAPLTNYGAFKIVGMWCATDGTMGAGESIVFTARSAEGNLTPSITCTIGTGAQYCRSVGATTTDVAAGATVAVKAVQTSDNADDNSWCRVYIQMQ